MTQQTWGPLPYVPPKPFLPPVNWHKPTVTPPARPVVPQHIINSVATKPQDTQAQIAAENAPLRIVYGRARIGAQVADVLTYGGNLIMLLVWCEGEINAIESVTIGDATVPAGVTLTNYTGAAGQTADATLVAAYASHSITYADTLDSIAYTVAVIPVGATQGFPAFNAIIQGRKLYDPRGATVYSDNPALALADFATSTVYGMGKTVDDTGLTAAADFCDTLCTAEKRRLIGLCIDNVQPCSSWLETLRTYAGCFISQEGSSLLPTPDTTRATDRTFDASQIIANSFKLKKHGVQNIPTLIDIRYTDTSVVPWAQKSAIAKADGVDAGTTPRRESQVSLPGIMRYTQAYREAVERLNKLTLSDLSASFSAFDEALVLQVGDVVEVTHPIGLTSKKMRVTGVSAAEAGRWNISAFEYDPAAYSDTVAAEPTYTDTTLPDPAAPPTPTAVTLTEEVFQLENGTYASRFRVTWTVSSFPFLDHYRVELWNGATIIHTSTAREAVWPTPAIQEGVTYTAKVAVISTTGCTGTWATNSATAQGKNLIPGDVPSITAFEAGGRVYISWTAATDLDIWRYDVRYGAVGGTYETATSMDHVDALRLETSTIPAGSWTIYVKAEDSVGQYSTTAASVNVTVTSDASAFLVSSYDQTNPGLTNMSEFALARTDANRYFVTDDGVVAATTFPAQADTYTNVAATYHTSLTSTWLGESEDFGLDLGGQWTGTATVSALSGSLISYFGYAMAAAPAVWTYLSGLSQKLNARFARMKHETLTTATLKVTIPTQSIRLDAVPRTEVGTGTSSAAAAVTVTLTNVYVATKRITITPLGTTARMGVPDNIVLGTPSTFDVYVFNDAGTKIASSFKYEWEGV